jgi:transcriptional regulator with PAS, ATPase and Fis domain
MQQAFISGCSRAFRKLLETVDDYASTPWPVLILGETGVGKELIARRLHQRSAFSAKGFLPINCGALPPALFESELFGYERGAFSGALQSQKGLIRSAAGGTLFLDEIGELETPLQTKLLRWLDSGEVRAVGSTRVETAQARLIAATHVDLPQAVAAGQFRLDLLERLGVLTLRVPSLRERPEDIVVLAAAFLDAHKALYEPADLELLVDWPWPGNVRQLRNVILRAVARGRGVITRSQLVEILREEAGLAEVLSHGSRDILDSSLADVEKRVIINRIYRCQGNKKQAAKELGIAKSTLHEKIRRWKDGPAMGHSLLRG